MLVHRRVADQGGCSHLLRCLTWHVPQELSPEIVVLILLSVIWLSMEFRQSRRTRPTATKAQDRCPRAVIFAPAAGVVAGTVPSWAVPEAAIRPPWMVTVIGLGALGCGYALRLWCFRTLRDYFTFEVMTSDDQPVITSGPYHFVRHPSYFGLILVMLGTSTLLANWLSLVVATLTTTLTLIAVIRVEDRVLHRELGSAYHNYAAATRRRLIPFVW